MFPSEISAFQDFTYLSPSRSRLNWLIRIQVKVGPSLELSTGASARPPTQRSMLSRNVRCGTHAHTHTHTHTHAHKHTHTHIHTHWHTYTHTRTHTCTHLYFHTTVASHESYRDLGLAASYHPKISLALVHRSVSTRYKKAKHVLVLVGYSGMPNQRGFCEF